MTPAHGRYVRINNFINFTIMNLFEMRLYGRTYLLLNGLPFTGSLFQRGTICPNSGASNGGVTSYTLTAEEQDSTEFLKAHSDSGSMPDETMTPVRTEWFEGFIVA